MCNSMWLDFFCGRKLTMWQLLMMTLMVGAFLPPLHSLILSSLFLSFLSLLTLLHVTPPVSSPFCHLLFPFPYLFILFFFFFSAVSKELPHFSQVSLSQLHAPTEQLNYHYYFSRGQPSFAFANFVAAKLVNTSNTSKKWDCWMYMYVWLNEW